MSAKHRPDSPAAERGTTYIELAIMSVIAAILLVSLSQALTSTTKGAISAKERARAQALAQDRLEEVKNLGYTTLAMRVSNYWYPDQPDPNMPLQQELSATCYPQTPPTEAEDPWTPEVIMVGKRNYWRHVVVKFVEIDPDNPGGGQLVQAPKPSPGGYPKKGGTNPGSNLAYIEVDVTWFSARLGRTEQVRLSTLLANPNMSTIAFGSISGTVLDTGVTPELSPGTAIERDADDTAITWSALVVMARNILTGEKYSTKIDITKSDSKEYGYYLINNIPNGSYEVLVFGAPKYHDGGYNGKNAPADELNQTISVPVSMINSAVKNINIWLKKTLLVKIRGQFIGVNGTVGPSPKHIQIYNSDLSSLPVDIEISNTVDCTATTPCWFVLKDVAWPTTGKVLWKTMVINLTDKVGTGATLCADASIASPASATDFYLGVDPATIPLSPAWNGCSAGCQGDYPGLGSDCLDPGDPGSYYPINLTANFMRPTLKVRVMEYYDGADHAFDSALVPDVRVSFLSTNDNNSATLGIASDGTTVFVDMNTGEGLIPIQPAPTIKLNAWINTTGYTDDSYFLPFDVKPGGGMWPISVDYNLIVGVGAVAPEPDQQYTFRLVRTAAVSGTVWLVAGTKGFVNASVRIALQSSAWNNVVTTDGSGRFVHAGVPQNSGAAYVVSPIAGADYVSTPASRNVLVNKNGVVYSTDTGNKPLEFTLMAINGVIKGTVRKGSRPVNEGAVVIATTVSLTGGVFPATLPSTALNGGYTYSTVTYSDGTFHLKVGTGLGDYYLYAFTRQDGTEASCGPCDKFNGTSCEAWTPIAVSPGTVQEYDICIH